MGQPPEQPSREKGLSAHQAGLLAPHGKTVYDPDAVPPERPGGLTISEEKIVELLAEDLTNEEISWKTGTALATVKSPVPNILGKIKGEDPHFRHHLGIAPPNRRARSAIVSARPRNLILKELLAKQGSSAAPESRPD